MYLSQLMFNPQSRTARIDLADRYELHRTLLSAFPADLPSDERVLYRVEDQQPSPVVPVLVQSHTIPDWEAVDRLAIGGYLADPPQIRPISPILTPGDRLPFRLQANPTVKRDGKRHAIYEEDALIQWLGRKGEQSGFRFDRLDVRVVQLGKKFGKKRQQTWHAVQFDGLLEITDGSAFEDALASGIGSAKAFGFGLLSIPYRRA